MFKLVDISSMTSSITTGFVNWAKSGLFWTIGGIIVLFIIFYFYAFMSRRSKLKYNCLEVIRFGNGKVGVNLVKAGVFKRKRAFFGLIDHGMENCFKVADGREIEQARTSFLHDIFGKKGFWLVRKANDPKILVPVRRVDVRNLELLMEIAPADYREAGVRLFREAQKETSSTWEKILPYIAIGLIVILCIITVIINQQMTNNTVDKMGKLATQGCSNVGASKAGVSP
jgi:hypothetical protein